MEVRAMSGKWKQPRYSRIDVASFLAVCIVAAAATSAVFLSRSALRERRTEGIRRAALVSPLPHVSLAKDSDPSETFHPETFRQAYQLSRDWVTGYVELWNIIYAAYKGRPVSYLEIGAFEGGSTVWMLENVLTDPKARATVIDPFIDGTRTTYESNLALSGSSAKVTTLVGFSQLILRTLPLDSYELIYVDGSHIPHDVLEDAVLCWRLLKVGGIIVFDNYTDIGTINRDGEAEYAKLAIDPFVECFATQLEVLHRGRQLVVRKTK
jgi:predicted O-methyltransferase YrrM